MPKRKLTQAESYAFQSAFDYAMHWDGAGPGWPVLWQEEDEALENGGLLWSMVIGSHELGAEDNPRAVEVFGSLTRWPWTWASHLGLLKDSYRRAIRWAWHCRYSATVALHDEGEGVLGAYSALHRTKHQSRRTAVLRAFRDGQRYERDAVHRRPKRTQGERYKLPLWGDKLTLDVRRALLVGFFHLGVDPGQSLPAVYDVRGDDGRRRRSGCDAVAIAEAMGQLMDDAPGPVDAAAVRGEVAIALLVQTRVLRSDVRDAVNAWRAAGEIVRRRSEGDAKGARALWDDWLAKYPRLEGYSRAPGRNRGTTYETVANTWTTVRPLFERELERHDVTPP